jgi:hypothetical protein
VARDAEERFRQAWFLTKGKEVLQWLRERLSEP